HTVWVFGVPQDDDVAEGAVQVVEAQRDSLYLSSAPRKQLSADAQMPCMKAELGKDCQPAVKDRAVFVQFPYALYAGDVDEGSQEAVLQMPRSVALAREAGRAPWSGVGDHSSVAGSRVVLSG